MKILVDMCLSPAWVEYLEGEDIDAQHWSEIGDPRASDRVILEFARAHSMVVFTHDLDFGAILAVTHAAGPSVIQVRTEDPVPERVGALVISAIREHAAHLIRGVLLTVEPERMRFRILPITPGPAR